MESEAGPSTLNKTSGATDGFLLPKSRAKRTRTVKSKETSDSESSIDGSSSRRRRSSVSDSTVDLSQSRVLLHHEVKELFEDLVDKDLQVTGDGINIPHQLASGIDEVASLRAVTDKLTAFLCDKAGLQSAQLKEVLAITGEYQDIVIRLLMTKNGRSRSTTRRPLRQQRQQQQQPANKSVSRGLSASKNWPALRVKPTPMPRKKPPSYAVVIKGAQGADIRDVEASLNAVGGNLDVRVRSMRPVNGGIRVETCSQSESQTIRSSEALKAAGLTVEDPKVRGERLVVLGVPSTTSDEVFMQGLYRKNGADLLTWEEFEVSVRLVSRSRAEDAAGSVVLEVPEKLHTAWLKQRRVYVGWSSFWVRPAVSPISCHNCYGFGHVSYKCPIKERVCKKCGKTGHLLAACPNALSCRNCRLKSLPDGHSVISVTNCPLYKRELAAGGRPFNE